MEAPDIAGSSRDVAARLWWPWAGLLVLAFALLTITHADADLWGHLRFGLDLLNSRHLTSVDPYSFTQDRPWLNHEWLSELIMAVAYRAAGPAGLSLLKATLVSLAFWLVWHSLRRAHWGIRIAAMAWLMLGAVHMVSSVRPQLWSFVAMAILCRSLADGSGRQTIWLPALFGVWANMHGGWIVGMGVLAIWMVVNSVTSAGAWRRSLLLIGACALASLCTPYGWRLWEFMAQTVRFERSIAEWLPLWRAGGVAGWIAWTGTTAAVMAIGPRIEPGRWARLAVLAVLAYASLKVMRIGSLYVTASLILLAPGLAALWPARARRAAQMNVKWALLIAAVPSVVAGVAAARIGAASLSCLRSDGPRTPDATAVDLLSTAGPGRLVTYFDWGEYAIWHLGPSLQVSTDGRRETVYSEAQLARHDGVVLGTPEGLATLALWHADYVWLPLSSAVTRRWLLQNGYVLALETRTSFVATRKPLPGPGAVRLSHSRVAGVRCFPD